MKRPCHRPHPPLLDYPRAARIESLGTGAFTSRREFLSGGLRVLSAAATLPLFIGHTARALADPPQRRRHDDHPILVVVQLSGGNDGLNTVIPVGHDVYHRARPRLAISAEDALPLRDGLALHSAATGLKALYDAGRLAIVQGVGYPNPNRSHFISMDIWQTADPRMRIHDGWLGRYVDACCTGQDRGPDPLNAVALMQESPLALQGQDFAPLAFGNPADLTWKAARQDRRAQQAFEQLNRTQTRANQDEHVAAFLERAALDALVGADEIRAGTSGSLGRMRGGNLGRQLDLVGRLIRSDLPTRIYYVSLGGFDTHSNQAARQRQLLSQLGDALEDFIVALQRDQLLDRVLVMCFSEFGRRVQENASGGTDHGEAGPMFLVGSRVHPGLHSRHPSLERLHRGDLAFGCDFRRVYASVLRDGLGVAPRDLRRILGGGYGPLRLIRSNG